MTSAAPARRYGSSLRSRLIRSTILSGCLLGLAAPVAAADVTIPTVTQAHPVHGTPVITSVGNTLTVTLTPHADANTIINWDVFNVGEGQFANFRAAAGTQSQLSVLNRVALRGSIPTDPTKILGTLNSDPKIAVFLINPTGIVFGKTAVVNVGSLIASSLNVSDNDFLGGTYNFNAGIADPDRPLAGVEVKSGAMVNATLGGQGLLGRVALIGVQVKSAGALKADNEVALVAASDVSVTFTGNSPMSVAFTKGTPVGGRIVADGTIAGRNVLFAAATQQDVNDVLLDVGATVTATAARTTDRGILLVAGATATAAPGVTFSTDSAADAQGIAGARISGTLTATGARGDVTLLSGRGIAALRNGLATIAASRNVLVRSDTKDIGIGDVDAGGTFTADATTGDLGVTSAQSAGTMRLTAAGLAFTGDLAATSGGADLVIQAKTIATKDASAGQDLSITAARGATMGDVAAGRNLTAFATSFSAGGARATTGSIDIATGGKLTLTGNAQAGQDASFSAKNGALTLLNATAGNDLTANGRRIDAGALTASAGALTLRAQDMIALTGAARAGADLRIDAGGDLTGGNLTAGDDLIVTARGIAAGDIVATAGSARLTTDTGSSGDTGSGITIGGAQAGVDVRLDTLGNVAVQGDVDAGRDYRIAALSVTLGRAGDTATSDRLQQAGRNIVITTADPSSAGPVSPAAGGVAITGNAGLTLRADADGDAGGRLTLTARNGGIDFAASSLLQGGVAGGRTGDVRVRLGQADAVLTLGGVEANAFVTNARAAITLAAPVTLTQSLDLRAGGPLVVDAIDIVGSGQNLTLATKDALTATGLLRADGNVDASSRGALTLAAITATNGTVALRSQTADVTAGAIDAGGDITVRARQALDVADVTSRNGGVTLRADNLGIGAGALSGASGVSARASTDIDFVSATSSGGKVTLASASGAVNGGDVAAQRAVVVTAPGRLLLGDVRSETGGVTLTSSASRIAAGDIAARNAIAVTTAGALTLGDVRAREGTTNLTSTLSSVRAGGVAGGAGVTVQARKAVVLGSVASARGAIDLTSDRATIDADRLKAGDDVTVRAARAVALADVVAAGAVDLTSQRGTLTAGQVEGTRGVTANARDAVTLGNVSADNGGVTITSRSDALTVGKAKAQGDVALTARQAILAGDIKSTSGKADLTSTQGGVTAGDVATLLDTVVQAKRAIALDGASSNTGMVSLTADKGAISAGALNGEDIRVDARDAVTVTRIKAGDDALLTSRADAVSVGKVVAGGDITADAAKSLETGDLRAGANILLSGRSVKIGRVDDATALDVDARGKGFVARDAIDILGNVTILDTGALRFVSIRSRGGDATLQSDGLVTGGAIRADAGSIDARGGTLRLAALRAGADIDLTAAGAATLRDMIDAGGALSVTGGTVALGRDGVALVQKAGGGITVRSTTGAITAASGLTLHAGTAGGGDLVIDSAGKIDFADGTTVRAESGSAGGDGAIRVALGSGAGLRLDRIDAAGLVSFLPSGASTSLAHDGDVRLGRTTLRDTLTIDLDRAGGTADLTLAGPLVVRNGGADLSVDGRIDGDSIVAADGIRLRAGTIALADATGASIDARTNAGNLTLARATARSGDATLAAAGNLVVDKVVAANDVTLRARGNIAGAGGIGTTVTARTGSADIATLEESAAGGAITLSRVKGGRVDVTGRAIVAERIDGGTVHVTARRAGGDETALSMSIGTIKATGDIVLASGGGTVVAGGMGEIGLDRATSRDGAIRITNRDGGLAARDPATGSDLFAQGSGGQITVAVAGQALLDQVKSSGPVDISAGAIRLGDLVTKGAIRLEGTLITADLLRAGTSIDATATEGLIDVTRADAGTGARFDAATTLDLARLTTGTDAALAAGTTMTLGTVTAGGAFDAQAEAISATGIKAGTALAANASAGDLTLGRARSGTTMTLAATGLFDAGTLVAGTGLDATASSITIGQATTLAGNTTLTAIDSGVDLDDGSFAGDVTLVAPGPIDLGTVASGGTLRATGGGVYANALTTGGALLATATAGMLDIRAADVGTDATLQSRLDVVLTRLTTGGAATLTAGGVIAADTLEIGTSLGATGVALFLGSVTTKGGDAALTATTGPITIDLGRIAGNATLTAQGTGITSVPAIDLGDIEATGTLTATSASGDIMVDRASAGGDLRLASAGGIGAGTIASTGGNVDLGAARRAQITTLTAAGSATVSAGAVAIDEARAGTDLVIGATAGDLTLGTGSAGGALTLTDAGGTIGLGTADAGTDLAITTPGALTAVDVSAGGSIAATFGTGTIASLTAGGSAALTASAGDVQLGDATTTSGDLVLTATNGAARVTGSTSVGNAYRIDAASITLGTADQTTLQAAETIALTSTGDITGLGPITLFSRQSADLTAGGDIDLSPDGVIVASTAVRVDAGGALALGRVDTSGAASLKAGTILAVDTITTGGALEAEASGDAAFGLVTSGGATTLTAGGMLAADETSSGGPLDIRAGSDATLGTVASDGTTTLTAGGRLAVGTITDVAALEARAGGNASIGSVTSRGALTLVATGNASLGSTTAAGDLTLTAGGLATLAGANAAGHQIVLTAADMDLRGAITASGVRLLNGATTTGTRLGDRPGDDAAALDAGANGSEFDDAGTGGHLDLGATELAFVDADTLLIGGGNGQLTIGDLALAGNAGRTSVGFAATGADSRIDILGTVSAAASTIDRSIVFGGDGTVVSRSDGTSRAAVIRVAATPNAGGRLLVGDATLDLRGDIIGVGQDNGFLQTIGFVPGGTPLAVDAVARRFVAQPASTLYNAALTQSPTPYVAPTTVEAGNLIVRYSQYALIQNTGVPGKSTGAVISAGTPRAGALTLAAERTSGGSNAFALFGTINDVPDKQTALVGPQIIIVEGGVVGPNSRANGCVIGTAAGCLSTSITQPTLNVFDTSRSEIFRTADDLSLPFDPLVGTNNEALYTDLDASGATFDAIIGSNNEALYTEPEGPCGSESKPCPPAAGDRK